jgi:hypothetical protein
MKSRVNYDRTTVLKHLPIQDAEFKPSPNTTYHLIWQGLLTISYKLQKNVFFNRATGEYIWMNPLKHWHHAYVTWLPAHINQSLPYDGLAMQLIDNGVLPGDCLYISFSPAGVEINVGGSEI